MSYDIDRVYFFGDSLSDTGNLFDLTDGNFPNEPYAPGRFSNGDIWVDYLTDKLNLTVKPSGIDALTGTIEVNPNNIDDGVNFAIGGATSGDDNFEATISLGLEQQIDAFELLVENQSNNEDEDEDEDEDDDDEDEDDEDDDDDDDEGVLNNDLSFLWIGANDYFNFIEDDPNTPDIIEANFPDTRSQIEETVSEVVETNIAGAIQDIIDGGGEEIVVFNLPDLDRTPLGRSLEREDRAILGTLSHLHNDRLLNTLDDLEDSNSDVNIVHININELFDEILENPGAFGLTNVTDNFSGFDLYTERETSGASGDPNNYFFWDSVHPTTAAHQIVADFVMDELMNEGLINYDD